MEKKTHLVEWRTDCSTEEEGGLGVKFLALFNKALLCKWNQRFAIEENSLWKMMIRLKYGVEEGD